MTDTTIVGAAPFPEACKAFLQAGPLRLRGLRAAGEAGAATRLVPSPNGRYLLITGRRGASLWDALTGDVAWAPDGLPAHAPAVSPGAARVAWAGGPGGSTITARPLPEQTPTEPRVIQAGAPVAALGFTTDGRTVVALDAGGAFRGFALESGELLWTSRCEALARPFRAAAVARDARVAVAACEDGTCAVIYPQTGTCLFRLGEPGAARTVALSHDAQQVLAGTNDGARLWDAASGALTRRLPGAETDVVALSPLGGRAVGVRRDGKLVLWDVWGGHALERLDLGAFLAEVHDVAFAPDGRTFVVAGDARRRLDGGKGRAAVLLRFELSA